MNESSDSLTVSPSQLLERLNALRCLQDAARNKLQNQRKVCRLSPGQSASHSVGGLLSQLTSDMTYQTFQSLLQNSQNSSDSLERSRQSLHRIRSCEKIDGVTELNLSQESELVLISPTSGTGKCSQISDKITYPSSNRHLIEKAPLKKFIEIEEMPILSPRKDFETLVLETIKNDNSDSKQNTAAIIQKKPFLKKGEGLSRFGMKKDDLVIQNTKALPWKRKSVSNFKSNSSIGGTSETNSAPASIKKKRNGIGIEFPDKKQSLKTNRLSQNKVAFSLPTTEASSNISKCEKSDIQNKKLGSTRKDESIHLKENDKPSKPKSNKTWATILTHDQETFLNQLKQSSYYKNFESPAKSSACGDGSCDESFQQTRQQKEKAEQNLFDLLENKVSSASFCSESSFIQKFYSAKPDCSGDTTPMLIKRCIANNPHLLQIFPPPIGQHHYTIDESTQESCENVECDHETCSSTSSCSTCKTVEDIDASIQTSTPQVQSKEKSQEPTTKPTSKETKDANCDDTIIATNEMKLEMAEMNAKLAATSELLKERLQELEGEIETFRRENANLTKIREEFDIEKQKFYDEKCAYEQKLNEDKILSEYYLAEEKEKLSKQKQTYERYIREMRGRLNKKEKDEVVKLKKDIEEMKEEFRNKEARSTACIARLRGQIKFLEKDKMDLLVECEKLKKENRRMQQVNTNTRRLSNLKYLSEINKKLSQIETNDKLVKVVRNEDSKYKSNEIETRSRAKKLMTTFDKPLRQRAKSVPNLAVTSRYAKYFSQRDAASEMEKERLCTDDVTSIHSDNSSDIDYATLREYENDICNTGKRSKSDENVEKIYSKKFGDCANDSHFDHLSRSSSYSQTTLNDTTKSPRSISQESGKSKSPIPPLNISRSNSANTSDRSKSPISILSNRSSSRKSLINEEQFCLNESNKTPENNRTHSDEQMHSGQNIVRTNLNPTEIKRPDGTRELRFPNGNVKIISADGKTSKFMYYNGDVKEIFYTEGKIKYFYAENKTYHTTHVDGLEVLEFPDGQVEKRYPDGSSEIRLANGSVRYTDPRNEHVSEEWRFPDGAVLTVARDGQQVVRFPNGQVEVHAKDHKRREYPDGTVKLVYKDGTSETRYASGRVRIKDSRSVLVMDSAAQAM